MSICQETLTLGPTELISAPSLGAVPVGPAFTLTARQGEGKEQAPPSSAEVLRVCPGSTVAPTVSLLTHSDLGAL